MKIIFYILTIPFFLSQINAQSISDHLGRGNSNIEQRQIEANHQKLQSDDDPQKPEKISGVLFGISAGINAGTRFYNYITIPNPPATSMRFAPSFGFILGYQFGNVFSLQSGLKYQGKGDKINMSAWLEDYPKPETVNAIWETEATGSITTGLHYVEASLLPVFGIGKLNSGVQFQLGLGGFAAYGLTGIETNDYALTYYLDYVFYEEEIVSKVNLVEFVGLLPTTNAESFLYYNSLDYGLLLYTGLRYKKINFGIHFTWGMKELEHKSFNFGYWTEPIDTSKTATTTFALTYFF